MSVPPGTTAPAMQPEIVVSHAEVATARASAGEVRRSAPALAEASAATMGCGTDGDG